MVGEQTSHWHCKHQGYMMVNRTSSLRQSLLTRFMRRMLLRHHHTSARTALVC